MLPLQCYGLAPFTPDEQIVRRAAVERLLRCGLKAPRKPRSRRQWVERLAWTYLIEVVGRMRQVYQRAWGIDMDELPDDLREAEVARLLLAHLLKEKGT